MTIDLKNEAARIFTEHTGVEVMKEPTKPFTTDVQSMNPEKPTQGATRPLIADSWRYGFHSGSDGNSYFGFMDSGPFIAYEVYEQDIAIAQSAANKNIADPKIKHYLKSIVHELEQKIEGSGNNLYLKYSLEGMLEAYEDVQGFIKRLETSQGGASDTIEKLSTRVAELEYCLGELVEEIESQDLGVLVESALLHRIKQALKGAVV